MYECHVTVEKPTNQDARELLESVAGQLHWKTSYIDGDPVLGKKVFFYFTTHSDSYDKLFDRMRNLASMLGHLEIPVIREKIEHIVYDTKRPQP